MGMWFEKKNEKWILLDDKGNSFDVEEDDRLEWIKSKAEKDEFAKARAYMKAKDIWDVTAFGAGMTVFLADAVVNVNGELKVLVFSTVRNADRALFKALDKNFKRKCLRRVDEFYSKKDYQQKIAFDDAETEEWNDHILRPIVLMVNKDGKIEDVVKHKDLLKMDVYPLLRAYEAVWFEKGRFEIGHSLRLYEEQYGEK